ncbi:hypothetical protein [Blastococcus sp. SYSU DS0619]
MISGVFAFAAWQFGNEAQEAAGDGLSTYDTVVLLLGASEVANDVGALFNAAAVAALVIGSVVTRMWFRREADAGAVVDARPMLEAIDGLVTSLAEIERQTVEAEETIRAASHERRKLESLASVSRRQAESVQGEIRDAVNASSRRQAWLAMICLFVGTCVSVGIFLLGE